MARHHKGLPRPVKFNLSKARLLEVMASIDSCTTTRNRILQIENGLDTKISNHIGSMVLCSSNLRSFNTSPYVIMIHAKKRGYSTIKELENDILPAKEFSSMETSAGRMIEEVLLPIYGWEPVPSGMHTAYSAIDGKKLDSSILHLATLKSGPRCLNDEMSENFADNIINNFETWAHDAGVDSIDFTYGVLYGTQKQSNKKDWHILRNLKEKLGKNCIIESPDGRWNCKFKKNNITVNVTVRIGLQWWEHLGGETCPLELASALIRSCVVVSPQLENEDISYSICDIANIISLEQASPSYNISILQKSQIPWLFFFMYHFCDDLLS